MSTAKELKAAGIAQAEANANAEWKETVLQVIEKFGALKNVKFTSDDVWEIMSVEFPNVKTHQPSAMGSLFKRAQTLGYIEATKDFVESTRPSSHARPVRVWKSTHNKKKGIR